MRNWFGNRLMNDRGRATGLVRRPYTGHVLVIGGAGYIGSMLCRRLLEFGRKVRVLDRMDYDDASVRDLRAFPSFDLVAGDWRDANTMDRALTGVKQIVHLAAVPGGARDGASLLRESHEPMRNLARLVRGAGVERFVLASSCAVYGDSESPASEGARLRPTSAFARLAAAAEVSLLQEASDDFHPTVLRLPQVFGLSWRQRWDLLVHMFAARAHYRRHFAVCNARQWRSFIHVRDVGDGIMRVLNAQPSLVGGEVFNLGDGRLNCTLGCVADRIRAQFRDSTVQHLEDGDLRHIRVSFDKFRRRLGFECALPLEFGIHELRVALDSGTQAYREGQEFCDSGGISECDEWLGERRTAVSA